MKLKNLFLLLVAIFLLGGCSQVDPEPEIVKNAPIEVRPTTYNVPDTTDEVSAATIQRILPRFNKAFSRNNDLFVESVSIKSDDNGNPLYYVVNYCNNGGFVVLSATKNFEPILAYSEYGKFEEDLEVKSGLSFWSECVENSIIESGNLPLQKKNEYRARWNAIDYIEVPLNGGSRYDDDALYDMQTKIFAQWHDDGYQFYNYRDFKYTSMYSSLDEGLKEAFERDVQRNANPYWGGDREINAYIVYKSEHVGEIGPLCKTKWSQGSVFESNGFNKYVPNHYPLGCTTIAAGQIMKYKKHPADISWDAMDNIYPNDVSSRFLYDLALKIGVSFGADGSSASINQVYSALKSYGYSKAKLVSLSVKDIEGYIGKSPLYMRGNVVGEDAGHAWVCDGISGIGYMIYEVWVLEDCPQGVQPRQIYRVNRYEARQSYGRSFHFNWGWGGTSDGYYYAEPFNAGSCVIKGGLQAITDINK